MSIKEKITDYLKQNGCQFKEINHKPAGSAEEYHKELGTQYEQQAKALFLRYKKNKIKSFVIVAIQAQKRCDLSVIKKQLNAKEVKLAQKSQLYNQTGCNFGELPPFGKPFGLKLFFDNDLSKQSTIYFNCGDLSFSIAISPQEIIKIENPIMFTNE